VRRRAASPTLPTHILKRINRRRRLAVAGSAYLSAIA
jgi:hypothetical protein